MLTYTCIIINSIMLDIYIIFVYITVSHTASNSLSQLGALEESFWIFNHHITAYEVGADVWKAHDARHVHDAEPKHYQEYVLAAVADSIWQEKRQPLRWRAEASWTIKIPRISIGRCVISCWIFRALIPNPFIRHPNCIEMFEGGSASRSPVRSSKDSSWLKSFKLPKML